MATANSIATPETDPKTAQRLGRDWGIFAIHSYARIAARKHGIVVPELNFEVLSDEEIEKVLRLMQELAHLPPA